MTITPSSSSALSIGIASTVRMSSTCGASPTCTRGRPGHRGCGSCAARGRRAPSRCPRPGADGILLDECSELGGGVVGGHPSQDLTVEAADERALGLAEPDRVLGQRLEDRLQIERRPPDHLEQLAGRRLLLERDPQLAVARLQLGEQAHVLDGDDGLVGEGLEQSRSGLGERSGAPGERPRSRRSARRPRSIGTPSAVRYPMVRASAWVVGNRVSLWRSSTCTTAPSSIARRRSGPSSVACGKRPPRGLAPLGRLTVLRDEVDHVALEPIALP